MCTPMKTPKGCSSGLGTVGNAGAYFFVLLIGFLHRARPQNLILEREKLHETVFNFITLCIRTLIVA